MNNKKVVTAILACIFVVLFALVGIGSCGGIKYIIDKRQSVATVYADEVGSGSVSSYSDSISVTLNKYSFYVDGYCGNGFPNVIDYSEYMAIGDLRFVAVYYNDELFSFFVTTLELTGDIIAGGFVPSVLQYRNTYLTSNDENATNLINIAFLNTYRGTIEPGCLEFSGSLIDRESCGRFVKVNVDIVGGQQPLGRFKLSLVFENITYEYFVSPFGWAKYGDYSVNKLLNYFSYRESFSLGSNSSEFNPQSYYKQGYDAAVAANKDIWFNQGYDEGESVGYDKAIADNKDNWFDEGYDEGYDEGESVGYDKAIAENKDNWLDQGYNNGYDVGLAEGAYRANDYSFIGLIGAVIDVPVKAFIGLTDFNLFGFNMTTFYKALFAFCAMVIVIRLVLP